MERLRISRGNELKNLRELGSEEQWREQTKGETYPMKTLLNAFDAAAKHLHRTLRDGNLMAKSIRREDLVRVDALNRLERQLTSYSQYLLHVYSD